MAKLGLSDEDYLTIEKACDIKGSEPYAVVYMPIRNKFVRSVHVFERKPGTKELTDYENATSKMRFRGNKAEIEGGAVAAAAELYRKTISRVFDIVVDRAILAGPIARDEAIRLVEPLVKREAIADIVGEVFRASKIAEMDGHERETADEADEVPPTGFSGRGASGPVPVEED
jgi:hypothetical protein